MPKTLPRALAPLLAVEQVNSAVGATGARRVDAAARNG